MFASVQSTNPTASALVSSNISKFKKNKRTKSYYLRQQVHLTYNF